MAEKNPQTTKRSRSESSLAGFHPLLRQWFYQAFSSPTDVQERSWREISAGRHVLITAPTGSGKTLAAFLSAINQLLTGSWAGGALRVLYVSPTKALNNDVRRNLQRPLAELEALFTATGLPAPGIRVLTRSGDTDNSERQRMYRKPPEILVTTPESLNILVTSGSGRRLLATTRVVILDEIHAVFAEKRGTLLITAVDRLVPLCGELQRIALSATVNPMSAVAEFVGGARLLKNGSYQKRQVSIVTSTIEKSLELTVTRAPEPLDGADQATPWPALAAACTKLIAASSATLIFTNSRRNAEKLTRLLNEGQDRELAYPHHGSLAKELRLAVEQRLKNGELRAIVATNSLELGIDIGDLDRVVLVQTPPSVAQAMQRLGRAGHRVGEVSRGLLFPLHGRDCLEAAVLARAVASKDIEELRAVNCPLDVLAQVILAMTVAEVWRIDELYTRLRASHPFRDLSRATFDGVLQMLAGRYADSRIRALRPRLHFDPLAGTVVAKEGVARLLYNSGGTIPDRGSYQLRHHANKAKVGELDEEFVWERRPGETFALGAQIWRIQHIGESAVEVLPVSSAHNVIPFWRGEPRNRPWHFAAHIGVFLEECSTLLAKEGNQQLMQLLAACSLDDRATHYLSSFLRLQRQATSCDLPHRHHLLIEHCAGSDGGGDNHQIILHTLWGGRINHPFSLALAAAWQERHGTTLTVWADNDSILLNPSEAVSGDELLRLVSPATLDGLLRRRLEHSGFFGALFRENCGRALLLPKSTPGKRTPLWLNRLRAKRLYEATASYDDFPLLLETWRECLQDRFDIEQLKILLDELQSGEIAVSEAHTLTPSPFAEGISWQRTNTLMYQDDTPESADHSHLNHNLVRQVALSPSLRPSLRPDLVERFSAKQHRTAVGYAPLTAEELIETVGDRVLLHGRDWQTLLEAASRDSGLPVEKLRLACGAQVVWLRLNKAGTTRVLATWQLPRMVSALGLDREQFEISAMGGDVNGPTLLAQIETLPPVDPSRHDLLPGLLAEWLAGQGPTALAEIGELFALDLSTCRRLLADLEKEGRVMIGPLIDGNPETLICDTSNLEHLLRLQRNARRPAFTPLDPRFLAPFLAEHQGLTSADDRLETLQEALDVLFGFPAPCNAWEEYLLPARVTPYHSSQLDRLLGESPLLWYGCGRQKSSFAFADDLELFTALCGEEAEDRSLLRLWPESGAYLGFFELQRRSSLESGLLTSRLWELIWTGRVLCDSFAPLRQGIASGFAPIAFSDQRLGRRHGGLARWRASRPVAGNFCRRPTQEERKPADSITTLENSKERVRQLLRRYGILFRDLLAREAPGLEWPALARTLRLMEISGELLSGQFFAAPTGPQYLRPATVERLRQGFAAEKIFWLNACDPASLCGVGDESLRPGLPSRLTTTYLVYHGREPLLILRKNGRELEFRLAPENPLVPRLLEVCRFLVEREVNPLKALIIDTINGEPATRSPYRQALVDFGCTVTPRSLSLRRHW